jgi:hypothetical protein
VNPLDNVPSDYVPKKLLRNMKMEITLETIYKKIVAIEHDVNNIKKLLIEEPELRETFIKRIKRIDSEQVVMIKDFGERYGLK